MEKSLKEICAVISNKIETEFTIDPEKATKKQMRDFVREYAIKYNRAMYAENFEKRENGEALFSGIAEIYDFGEAKSVVKIGNGVGDGTIFILDKEDLELIELDGKSDDFGLKLYMHHDGKTVLTRDPNIKKSVLFHRLLMDTPKGMEVHHINGCHIEHCKDNMIVLTKKQHRSLHSRKFKMEVEELGIEVSKELLQEMVSAKEKENQSQIERQVNMSKINDLNIKEIVPKLINQMRKEIEYVYDITGLDQAFEASDVDYHHLIHLVNNHGWFDNDYGANDNPTFTVNNCDYDKVVSAIIDHFCKLNEGFVKIDREDYRETAERMIGKIEEALTEVYREQYTPVLEMER